MEISMTDTAKAEEITRLKKLLRIREGKAGYAQNVAAIKAKLVELEGDAPADGAEQ